MHSFFAPRSPFFSRLSSFWSRLRALFREISPFIIATLPFSHSVKAFPIRASLILHALPHLYLPIYSPSVPHPPTLFTPSPLSLSFLPTFPSSSPINARSRAHSRTTRIRVHPHTPTRQEVFVYCLHRFTHPSQSAVHQHVKGEEKREKAFTKNSITSQSTH